MYKESDFYTQGLPEDAVYSMVKQPAYEGATISYKNGLKGLLRGEPDTLAAREVLFLQMRSAHAIRNNGTAKAARDKYVTNLAAITVNWKKQDGTAHEAMQTIWNEFADDPSLDGYGTLANIQSVWHSSMFQSGNSFTRYQIRRTGNKNKVPLKLETITPEIQYAHEILEISC